MVRVRNRLLILVALLVIGVAPAGVAFGDITKDTNPTGINPVTGEPDNPGVKTTTVSTIRSSETGGAFVISKTLLIEWAYRVWAAIHLGAIR